MHTTQVHVHAQVWEHPESEKLWCEQIDVGEDKPRQILSGEVTITCTCALYTAILANVKPGTHSLTFV